MPPWQAASCSFPRIDSARFGVPPNSHPGDRVLHLGCGDGALTKLLFARGLQVWVHEVPAWLLQVPAVDEGMHDARAQ